MLEGVIDRLPESLAISPFQTHGHNVKSRKIMIKDKLTKLNEKLEMSYKLQRNNIFLSRIYRNFQFLYSCPGSNM